jgi:hypothetical protein
VTQQQTQINTLVIPLNVTSLTTETITTTSTVFETLRLTKTFSTAIVTSTAVVTSTPAPVQRRDASISILPDRYEPTTTAHPSSNGTLHARQASNVQCRPATWGMDTIPQYATQCRDSKAYSSACQKMGVIAKTTTLQPSATYTTKVIFQTITPTIILSTTKTVLQTTARTLTNPITRLQTTNVTLTTFQTLTTTSTSFTTSTLTSTVRLNTTLTSTALVSAVATSTTLTTSTFLATPTPCPGSFRLSVTGTPVGNYIRSFGESEKYSFTSNTTLSTVFALDASSLLYEPATNMYPNTEDRPLYYVYQESVQTIQDNGYLRLKCGLGQGGAFDCAKTGGTADGKGKFFWCPVIAPVDALVFGSEEGKNQANGVDCVELDVAQECVV